MDHMALWLVSALLGYLQRHRPDRGYEFLVSLEQICGVIAACFGRAAQKIWHHGCLFNNKHCATIAFAVLLCPRGGLRTATRSFQHLLSSTNIHPVSESHPALMHFFICYCLHCLCDMKSCLFKSLG